MRAVIGATRFRQALLLAIAIVAAPQFALAQPETEPGALPLIIRGSSLLRGSESSGSDLVLRGTPPPAPVYTCSPGYLPDPSFGCVTPGLAYAPSSLDYGPFAWPYDAYVPQRRFGRARAPRRFGGHVAGRGRTERFAHR